MVGTTRSTDDAHARAAGGGPLQGGQHIIGGRAVPGRGVAGDHDGVGALEGLQTVLDREAEPVVGRDERLAGSADGELVEIGPQVQVRTVPEDLQRAGQVEGDQAGQSERDHAMTHGRTLPHGLAGKQG